MLQLGISVSFHPTHLLIKHSVLLHMYHLNIRLLLIFAASRLRARQTAFFFCISVNEYLTGAEVHLSGARDDLEILSRAGRRRSVPKSARIGCEEVGASVDLDRLEVLLLVESATSRLPWD